MAKSLRKRPAPVPCLQVHILPHRKIYGNMSQATVWSVPPNTVILLNNHQFLVAYRESLSNPRQRLGALPMQKLHEEMALTMAEKSLPGSYFKDLLLVAFDGSTLAL